MGRRARHWTAADEAAMAAAVARHRAGDLDTAGDTYRKLARRHPRHGGVRAMHGALLLQTGRAAPAAEELRAAIAAGADDAGVHNNLALALRALGRHDDAVAAYRKALALAPDAVETRLNLGNELKALGRAAEAEAELSRAVAGRPDFAPAHVALGNLRATVGDRGGAAAAYRDALALSPDDANAFYHLALLAKGAGDASLSGDAARFRRRLDAGELAEDDAIAANFALGGLADRAGDHDEAFARYHAANELILARRRRRGEAFDAAANAADTDAVIAAFPAELLERASDGGRRGERPVLIVGMPRSGTTLVEQILDSHPEIHGAGELDEVPRLAAAVADYPAAAARLDRNARRRLADRYLARLGELGGAAARVCDKRPANFQHLGLIALLLPGARIIHCRRDPLDVCLSCYFQNFASGNRFTNDFTDLAAYWRDYRRLMAHWRAVLPNAMLEVDYESLVDEPERVSRDLVAFCGLAWDDRCLAFDKNRRAVTTASNLQVREPVHRRARGRWRRYAARLGPLRAALGDEWESDQPAPAG